ncbi:MAG: HAD family hydrolase [Treponema sp.]|jgi:phosphoglycolate phosphatase/putative hydrolase of the HAD superfamily|nr:HAD family hydrolase [Treponema sp.]
MKAYNLPDKCAAVLFDMDSTLYSHPEYARSQIDLPIERLAKMRGISFGQMNEQITQYRSDWAKEHNGQTLSLGNIFKTFGISISENVKWREELYQPERYLSRDTRLRCALEELGSRFALAVVTNNPVSIAKRTLRALGVEGLFSDGTLVRRTLVRIVGLDTCGVSKPHEEPFRRAAVLCNAPLGSCVSVGDRYDIDIALPLELGMGGVLVDGVEDVYKLPEVLGSL